MLAHRHGFDDITADCQGISVSTFIALAVQHSLMPPNQFAGTSRLFRHSTLPVTVNSLPDLYAKLLSSCKGVLIHPLHVLLNVSIKFFIWSISAPLYQVGVLYAVSWRPASHAQICMWAACKHAWNRKIQNVVEHCFAECWYRMLYIHNHDNMQCCPQGTPQGSTSQSCGTCSTWVFLLVYKEEISLVAGRAIECIRSRA